MTALQVWSLHLAAPDEVVDAYASLLSEDERERRHRLIEGPVRDRFTLARGALRILLGRYLAREPASIEFVYGRRGKPALADQLMHFNLAHSEELAVYAFSSDRELGIDVERVRDLPEMKQIVRRFFSREEADVLESLAEDDRACAFYRAWTRKEAYVKAVGDGLHIPLNSFCVSFRAEEPPRLVTAPAWQLHHLEPAAGYLGALAYCGTRMQVIDAGAFDCAELLKGGLS